MPDDGLTVEATNGPAFDNAIARMAKDLTDISGPLQAAARELAVKAQAAAPRRTGRLAGSHRVLPDGTKKVRVEADTPYAAVIHWGWPGHGISRQPWLVATWLSDPAPLNSMTGEIQSNIDKAAAST